MEKQRLLRLKKLNKEVELLKENIRKFEYKPREQVADTVKDYRTGYPQTIVIEGVGDKEYIKNKGRLYRRYIRKLIEIQKEIEELEMFLETIDDPELRVLLRLRFINGLTQEQIADKLGYSRSAVAMKIKRFFDLTI